eukprot:RCo002431
MIATGGEETCATAGVSEHPGMVPSQAGMAIEMLLRLQQLLTDSSGNAEAQAKIGAILVETLTRIGEDPTASGFVGSSNLTVKGLGLQLEEERRARAVAALEAEEAHARLRVFQDQLWGWRASAMQSERRLLLLLRSCEGVLTRRGSSARVMPLMRIPTTSSDIDCASHPRGTPNAHSRETLPARKTQAAPTAVKVVAPEKRFRVRDQPRPVPKVSADRAAEEDEAKLGEAAQDMIFKARSLFRALNEKQTKLEAQAVELGQRERHLVEMFNAQVAMSNSMIRRGRPGRRGHPHASAVDLTFDALSRELGSPPPPCAEVDSRAFLAEVAEPEARGVILREQ